MVQGHQVLLNPLLVQLHVVASNAVRAALSVLSGPRIFVLQHALLLLVCHPAYLKFVYDFHLRLGGAIDGAGPGLKMLGGIFIDPALMVGTLIRSAHAASIDLHLGVVRLVLRGGRAVPDLPAQRQLSSLILRVLSNGRHVSHRI